MLSIAGQRSNATERLQIENYKTTSGSSGIHIHYIFRVLHDLHSFKVLNNQKSDAFLLIIVQKWCEKS